MSGTYTFENPLLTDIFWVNLLVSITPIVDTE
jgi:hypothetical protein